jgi:hypothetical protein
MALGYLGRIRETFPTDVSPEFTAAMMAWQARATQHVGPHQIGAVVGTLEHTWHGPKAAPMLSRNVTIACFSNCSVALNARCSLK